LGAKSKKSRVFAILAYNSPMKMTSILSLVVTLLVPIVLIGLGLRILLTPLFYRVEYNMPYFPPDEYGFTKADRLKWAPYAVTYLINSADISYLGDLKFDDGTPLYNERELSHMHDVKVVTKGALNAWYVALALLIGLGLWSRLGLWEQAYRQGLMRGGWLMVGLAAAIGIVAVIGILINPNIFFSFFAGFHKIFFEGDSWMFYYSDTLIRLFPIRFWQDAFLWAAVIALGGGVGLGLGLRRG
jgi:integral membrane protein (TIGR01906 family)